MRRSHDTQEVLELDTGMLEVPRQYRRAQLSGIGAFVWATKRQAKSSAAKQLRPAAIAGAGCQQSPQETTSKACKPTRNPASQFLWPPTLRLPAPWQRLLHQLLRLFARSLPESSACLCACLHPASHACAQAQASAGQSCFFRRVTHHI